MNNDFFKAYVVAENGDGFDTRIQQRTLNDLPQGDLVVRVSYSSLNYKDALSAAGNHGITKHYPHTPGIDAVGHVVQSNSTMFSIGDEVIVTGFDLGMNTAGGFAEFIRIPSHWALPLPKGLTAKESMILGTAGLTAALSVHKLSRFVDPANGPIAVSGATGGVGSLAIAILSQLGYEVIAISGKNTDEHFLKAIGASAIIHRHDFDAPTTKPMLSAYLGGAIDTVGGAILDNFIKLTKAEGAVTCCGNAASGDLDLTVYPFILRGISLLGIDSQNCPITTRKLLWENLATTWKPVKLMDMYQEIPLDRLNDAMARMRQGMSRGRTIVNLNA